MPSKNLGINIVLEDVTYDALKSLSDKKGLSMAQMVAELDMPLNMIVRNLIK